MEEPQKDTIDKQFRIHQGTLKGTICWGSKASEGTKKGREDPISLRGEHDINWYPDIPVENFQSDRFFRYTIVKITK